MYLKAFVLLLLPLLVGASVSMPQNSEKSFQDKCAAGAVVDLTDEALKKRLANAKRWTPVSPLQVERPSPGVKVSSQRFEVLDALDGIILVRSACIGVCQGLSGCGVEGCDPDSGGCSAVVCTDGTGCESHCNSINIS